MTLSLLCLTSAPALAGTAEEINILPTLDPLNRSEETLSNGGKWSALAWDSSASGHNTGRDTTSGWGPYDAFSTVNGAYWNPSTFNDKTGSAAAVTMQISPGSAERYVALWLDMASPGSAKSGYQLRWTVVSGSTYSVTLSKFSTGTQTVLASNASVTIPTGTTLAISDTGGTVTAWQGTGGTFSSLLSASDTTYTSGYAGIEGSGNISRSTNFKAGNLLGGAIAGSSVLDNLEREEVPLATGKWSKTSWAAAIGGAWMGGYRGYGSSSGLAGAFWNPATFSDGEGTVLAAATVGTGSVPTGQYSALLLNMPNPGSARSGYEARFTGTGSATNYTVELAKWVSGTRTVLASTSGFSLPVGTTMALTETPGGSLALWTGTSTLSPVLTASDSTYTSGYAGLEVNGGAGTVYNFRAGNVDNQAPNTTIASGPTGSVPPEAVSFTFTSTESGSIFECSLDAAVYSACTSPKTYSTIAQGPHTFRARAIDAAGNQDETAAERSFTVLKPPSATTNAATAVSSVQATLNATVNPNSDETTYQFEYGTTTSYGAKAPAIPKAIGSGASGLEVSEPLTALTPDTVYHFRVSATNSSGTIKGKDRTFTTTAAPTVTTEAASELSAEGATLNALVNPKGDASTYQFEYGPTTAYGTKVPVSAEAVSSGTSAVAVSEAIGGLTEGTIYHYRVVAGNSVGTTYGADRTLSTLYEPDATTETAVGVNANEAILESTVDPNGTETTYKYEYGPTNAYGSTVMPAGEEIGSGTVPAEANAALAHLTPETTYHYRVVATSDAGTVTGTDKTLTTTASTVSPQREQEEFQEELTYTGKLGNAVPADFLNLHWSGNNPLTAEKNNMEVIRRSGANMLRLGGIGLDTTSELIFERAAYRDITLLPSIGGGLIPPRSSWPDFRKNAEAVVRYYGHGGEFWNKVEPKKRRPPPYWEVSNEPNVARNGTTRKEPDGSIKEIVDPVLYGEFLEEISKGIKAADPSAKVLIGGLLATGTPEEGDEEDHRTIIEFLNQMGNRSSFYDSMSLHPYVFKANGGATPSTDKQVEQVANRVREIIRMTRFWLDTHGGGDKDIWVTELGWPVENPQPEIEKAQKAGKPITHPAVDPVIQRKLLEASFNLIKAKASEWSIRNVFYYNIQDWDHNDAGHMTWDYRSGLRAQPGDGHYRPSWYGFQQQANVAKWPLSPKVKTKQPTARSNRATLIAGIDPLGSPTSYRFKWGPTTSYGNTTPWESAGFEENEVDKVTEISGLAPEQVYHVRAFAINDNGEEEKGEDVVFKTEPKSETTGTVHTYNGEPGWASVSGWVKSEGVGLSNVLVNVNFLKENTSGGFDLIQTQHPIVTNGQYQTGNIALGKGNWEFKTVFHAPQQGYDASYKSESAYHPFTLKNAYQLVAKHSGKCLDVSNGSTANTTPLVQWECLSPQTQLNQDFSLAPQSDGSFQIVARHSNRCVDVTNASQSQGVQLQQYDCLGIGQTNQLWQGVDMGPNGPDNRYVNFVAKHSGQCMDVQGGSAGNGVPVTQWGCLGGNQANQIWTFKSVEANQVPVKASMEVDEILDGHPGYVTFHGNVTANGYNMSNKWVNVNFLRWNGSDYKIVEEETTHAVLNANGYFSQSYWGVGSGKWKVKVVFPGEGPLDKAESVEHPFTVRDGYRFKFRHSDKCLSTSGGGTTNGTPLIQWDCSGSPNPGDGQVFSVRPVGQVGSNHFQIRPDSNTNMCVDVSGWGTGNGTYLQLWQCNDASPQANQVWHIVPIAGQAPWFASIATHSNRCMDVAGVSVNNGARVWQWDCTWGGNQQWLWQPIG